MVNNKNIIEELKMISEMRDINKDFVILYNQETKESFVILLHFKILELSEFIKTEDSIYGVVEYKIDGINEKYYLKKEFDKEENKIMKESLKINLLDLYTFLKSKDDTFKTIQIDNNISRPIKIDITEEMKDYFNN